MEAYNNLVLREVPCPRPREDEILVRVRACGICGSDVHGLDGSTGRRIPPLVMGHEAAGEVVELGSAVSGPQTGARVTFDSTVYCGECRFCRYSPTKICVATPELRAGELQKVDEHALALQRQADAQAKAAAEAREKALAHKPLSPDETKILDMPPDERAQQTTATADSGQGKPADAAQKPHKGFLLDWLIR